MSGTSSPNSHNILVAEYTLGLLDLHDMAKAHQLLSSDDRAVEMALDWEDSLLELTDLLAPVDPSPLLLQRIQGSLGHEAIPSPSSLYRQPSSMRNREDSGPPAQVDKPDPTAVPAASNEQARHPAGSSSSAPAAEVTAAASAHSPAAQVTPISSRQPRTQQSSAAHAASAPASTSNAAANVASITSRRDGVAPAGQPSIDKHHGAASGPVAADHAERPPSSAFTASGAVTPARQVEHTIGESSVSSPRPAPPDFNGQGKTQQTREPQRQIAPSPDTIPITAPSGATPQGAAPRQQAPTRAAGNVWLWRAATVVFAGLALALALIPGKPVEPPVTIVKVAPTRAAILQAPGQSSTPAWIVTFDPQGNVLMSPEVRSDIPADASVQLWTYNETLPQPRSLGLVDPNKPVTVPASLMGDVGKEQYFEMTLEPQGGSANASPSGPVLFIGRVVVFGAAQPAQPAAGLGHGQPSSS